MHHPRPLPLPWTVPELADYATHDIANLTLLLVRVPTQFKSDIVHASETMRRLALFVEAISAENDECVMRIVERAAAHEARLQKETEALLGSEVGALMRSLFYEHRVRRGPGETRARGMGFERGRRDDNPHTGG